MRRWIALMVLAPLAWPATVVAAPRQLRLDFRPTPGLADPQVSTLEGLARRLAGQGADVALAGPSLDLPAGSWAIEARSGDWITPRPLEIEIRRDARGGGELPLRLVPACALAGAAGEWSQGQDQVAEVLSLDYGSVFRSLKGAVGRLAIPAGSFVVSRLKGRERLAVSSPLRCAPGQSLALPFPPPPAAGECTLYLALTLPKPAAFPAPSPVKAPTAALSAAPTSAPTAGAAMVTLGAGAQPFPPGASTGEAGAQVAIFYRLPADRPLDLAVAHPAALTHLEELSGSSGGVLAPTLELLPRKRYELELDYRPARPHRRAELVVSHCGFEPGSYSCREFARQALAEGQERYAFAGLDRGQYRLAAEIDDYVLDGLGRGVSEQAAKLVEYDAKPLSPDSYSISESHIFGNILADGVAVAGRVLLENPVARSRPRLEFPTDDELLFHIYYFGAEETVYTLAPDEKETRRRDQIPRAIPADYGLTACTSDGFCRPFNRHSRIRGEGRLDIEIGSRSAALLTVLDETTLKPLDAVVNIDAEEEALIFEDGAERWVPPAGAEGHSLRTDDQGRVTIPLPGDQPLAIRAVRAEGYEIFRGEIKGVVGKVLHRTILLKREGSPGGHKLLFPDGQPIAAALLLPIGPGGERRLECATKTAADGSGEFSARCRGRTKAVLVLHPRVIAQLDPGLFRGGGETVLPPAPDPPLRLRLSSGGEPAQRVAVELRYPGFAVGIDDLLAAGSIAGQQLFSTTNQVGELLLRGVDPNAGPSLVIGGRLYPVVAAGKVLELAID